MTTIAVIACDDDTKAATAVQYLIGQGFPAGGISTIAADAFSYDGQTFLGGGTTSELLVGKVVVIGRK